MSARQPPSLEVSVLDAIARRTCPNNSNFSTGLIKKPNAPHRVACTAAGMVPWAVKMMTLISGQRLFNSFSRPSPSIGSMRKSLITRSGRNGTHASNAACALLTHSTS